jgi:hypothetical protein
MPITPFLIIGAISWILVGQIAEAKRPTVNSGNYGY